MSEPRQAASAMSPSATAPAHRARPAGWVVGLSLFAGIMMMVGGVFNAVEGLVALFRNEVYVATVRYIFAFDLTTWGWIQLIVGLIVLAAGYGVVTGRRSLLIIALNVFVIWALCVFNRDAAAAV